MIATTGRDGHILVYDIRASGRISPSPSPNPTPDAPGVRRSGRTRYSAGVPGFAAQEGGEIGPVLEIRSAHGDGSKKVSKGPNCFSRECIEEVVEINEKCDELDELDEFEDDAWYLGLG